MTERRAVDRTIVRVNGLTLTELVAPGEGFVADLTNVRLFTLKRKGFHEALGR